MILQLARLDARPRRPVLCPTGHVGIDGMKVDPIINVDLNKLPTGPARGHDMLLN